MRKILFILLTISNLSWAQSDFDMDTTRFEDKLFNLAWKNYPANDITKMGNYMPVINYSNALSLGISTGKKVKISPEESLGLQKALLKAEVEKRYNRYLTSIEILKVRIRASEEAHLIHLITTKKVKREETDLDEYNKSSLIFNNATEAKILAESEVGLAKLNLEELIGVKLEQLSGSGLDMKRVTRRGDTLITGTGLKYVVKDPGFGPSPKIGQMVKVYYSGKVNGKEFESNLNDTPFKFTLGAQQALKGMDEGLRLMKEGEKGTLIIPAKLAFGNEGIKDPNKPNSYLVPPNAWVIYDLQLVDIK